MLSSKFLQKTGEETDVCFSFEKEDYYSSSARMFVYILQAIFLSHFSLSGLDDTVMNI